MDIIYAIKCMFKVSNKKTRYSNKMYFKIDNKDVRMTLMTPFWCLYCWNKFRALV